MGRGWEGGCRGQKRTQTASAQWRPKRSLQIRGVGSNGEGGGEKGSQERSKIVEAMPTRGNHGTSTSKILAVAKRLPVEQNMKGSGQVKLSHLQ